MKTKETSKSEQIFGWWNNLSDTEQYLLSKKYNIAVTWKNVLGKEYFSSVEQIWKKETQESKIFHSIEVSDEVKAQVDKQFEEINAKQFKQFDESLFRAYINKFSDEDKIRALQILNSSLPDCYLKDHINKWFSLSF